MPVNPKSLANLRPPSKPGEPSRNPTGKNGRTRGEYVSAWLARTDDNKIVQRMIEKLGLPPETSRIDAVLYRDLVAALGSSEPARKTLIEQFAGRPRQQVELSGSLDLPPGSPMRETSGEIREKLMAIREAIAKLKEPAPDGNSGS